MRNLPALTNTRGRFSGEYKYIEDVVRIRYPIRAARTYLRRNLGNTIHIHLVEVERGEDVGNIRRAEVISADGAPTVEINVLRTLPDGSPASFYTPIEFVDISTEVVTVDGSNVPPLQSSSVIVLYVPVSSYLQFLPGIYSASAPVMRRDVTQYDDRTKRRLGVKNHALVSKVDTENSDKFRDFMLLFHHMQTTVLNKIDDIDKLTDPLTVEPKFLPWLASWLNFHLNSSLPLHQQRELVRRAILLQRIRGTRNGVAEMVRILTSAPVDIKERKKPAAFVLGKTVLGGGRRVEERFLKHEPAPSFMLSPSRKAIAFFVIQLETMQSFRNRFGERGPDILRQITQIVSREMPAQVVFTIEFKPQEA